MARQPLRVTLPLRSAPALQQCSPGRGYALCSASPRRSNGQRHMPVALALQGPALLGDCVAQLVTGAAGTMYFEPGGVSFWNAAVLSKPDNRPFGTRMPLCRCGTRQLNASIVAGECV